MKALVIGAGRIASTFDRVPGKTWVNTHLGAYKKNRAISKIALCDSSSNALASAADFWCIKDTFSTLDEALKVFEPDIVSVCAGAAQNLGIIKTLVACKAIKGVWIEKPFSDTVNNALLQHRLLSSARIQYITNYQRRFDGFYVHTKNHLTDLVGNVQKCTAFFSGGVINSASHLINLLLFYFGLPTRSCALSIERSDNDFHGDFKIDFGAFSAFCFEINRQSSILAKGYSIFELQIWGDKGRVDLRSLPFNEYDYRYCCASDSRFKGVKILKQKRVKLFFKRDFMETGLSYLLSKLGGKKIEDTEQAIDTLKVFKSIGVVR